jgi:hypothetical protein
MKRLLLLFLAFGLALAARAQTPVPETAEARLERFLTAMGGRAAWAAVKSYEIRATHYEAPRAPYANTIWNDFAWPAVRIEARGPEFTILRAIDGDQGWRQRDGGEVTPLTREQVEDEKRWWESNLYRTVHRLARRDPELSVRTAGDSRLEVWRADGKRLNWVELNVAGEPIRFGTWDNETGSVFGPLIQQGPVKCPKWGANAAGTWRYEVVELRVSERPSAAQFKQP